MQCYKCGAQHRTLSEVNNLRQVGVSLCGDCKSCGTRNQVGDLWSVQRRDDARGSEPIATERVDGRLVKVESNYVLTGEGLLEFKIEKNPHAR